ncbi:hypothetical protein Ddye_023952 [Dipteronia dyeriana]|uniref:DUF4283 domain-containing protein n=1 Tax=Dipteronia dyeriana TaxID=168575 RepID=A0AAD9TTZ3_9ROSI|nr:hypothetical protein Ddye_023952 [Dipteronia dyeriana]
MHGLMEDPMSLEASLFSSPQSSSTTTPTCCKGMVSSNSKGCSLGNVMTTISFMGDQSVTVGGSTQLPVMNSNPLPSGKMLVVLSSRESPWKLADLKAKLGKHWIISEDWRLISLGKGYFQIILKFPRDKNKKSTNAHVWVRFYDLSWEYWHQKIIFDLARGIGVPLRMDKAIIDGEFGHYVRVLVDVDMSTLLPSLVLLERDEIHSSFISVEYENLPSFCSIFSSIGHLPGSCHWNKSKVPTASVGKSSQSMVEVSIEDTTFQPVRSRSSKVVYRPIDKTVQEVPVSNAFAAIYQDLGPIDSVVVHQSVSSGPYFVQLSNSSLTISSSNLYTDPSSTVVGSIPIPLSGAHNIQQVCSLLLRKAPPSSFFVVSSGPQVMGTISLGVSSQSLSVGVSIASSGLTIQNDKLLSDSQAELRFITDSS